MKSRDDHRDETVEPDPLEDFAHPSGEEGLSLDELSESFAQLIGQGKDPYVDAKAQHESDDADSPSDAPSDDDRPSGVDEDDDCPVTPRSILEAMLFVGNADNEPLTSRQVASLMRGVRAAEIHDLVAELNEEYRELNCPYFIDSSGAGYQMRLREEFASVRENFYGKIRQARLSQTAVDVLSVVSYNQPITRKQVEELCQKPSGSVLSQLVRRQLLRVKRTDDQPRRSYYYTTDRFLQLFGLDSLDELPRSQTLDREL